MELGVGGATRVAPPKCVAPPQSSRLHSGVLGFNWQSLHEFNSNTDINVCCSGLTCARALSAPGWWRNKWQLIFQHTALALNKSEWFVHFFFFFSHHCCCNVLGSQNAHPLTETYISRPLFVLRVIYNKPYYTCVVRFKLNRGPSACRTVCGEPFGSVFFPRTVPPLLNAYKCHHNV